MSSSVKVRPGVDSTRLRRIVADAAAGESDERNATDVESQATSRGIARR
ncbi:hypothetical protein QZH41_013331, partial [Actinostola sp. cb2023]